MSQGWSPLDGGGRQRTDMHCHECNKTFIAELDFDIDGNHIIECPHCAHEHCRVITQGKITGERWDTRRQRVNVEARCVWKSSVIQAKASTASQFIRNSWLNLSDRESGYL